jgi:acyl-CoA reductase-like NAD-dependent aldehyde dehydrogenase
VERALRAAEVAQGGLGGAGSALVRHPRVKRLSFVGSLRMGMAVQSSAAEVAVKSIRLTWIAVIPSLLISNC